MVEASPLSVDIFLKIANPSDYVGKPKVVTEADIRLLESQETGLSQKILGKIEELRSLEELEAITDPKEYAEKVVGKWKGVIGMIMNGVMCRACGQKTAIRFEKQDRSGDEGASTYFRCTDKTCGNIWRKA